MRRAIQPGPSAAVLFLAGVIGPLCGCVEFNVECTPDLRDPEGLAGYLGSSGSAPVSLLKVDVRTQDHPLGQLLAEAYAHAFDDIAPNRDLPRIGVENSGAIRSECRETLSPGPVRRKVLRPIVPFDNQIFGVAVSHAQLKAILEHSVAGFTPVNTPPNRSPPGSFLQLWGLAVVVDCSRQGEELDADGSLKTAGQRVRRARLMRRDDPATEDCVVDFTGATPARACPGELWLAVNSFLYAGKDGYRTFKETSGWPDAPLSAGVLNFNAAAGYWAKTYPKERPFPRRPAARYDFQDTCTLR